MKETKKLAVFLTQLALPEDERAYFEQGELTKVIVHRQQRLWQFKLVLPTILPIKVYQHLVLATQAAFKDIASTSIFITVEHPTISADLIKDYWQECLTHTDLSHTMINEVCAQQHLNFSDHGVTVTVANEVLYSFMEKQALPTLLANFKQAGFPNLMTKIVINSEQNAEKAASLVQKKQREVENFSEQARQQIIEKERAASDTTRFEAPVANTASQPAKAKYRKATFGNISPIVELTQETRDVTIEGYIFDSELKTFNSGRSLLTLKVTDYTSSVLVKRFSGGRGGMTAEELAEFHKGMWVKIQGSLQEDQFSHELALTIQNIESITHQERQDTCDGEKRVELHVHTTMSQMDATNSITDFVNRAADWGHEAIAVTDHVGAQAYPDAYAAGKKRHVKILYGVEVNLVDDGNPAVYNVKKAKLADAEYVIFDVETTGLSSVYDTIIELGAVKMKDGQVLERFDEFINPGHPLSALTINLTSITDEMVQAGGTEADIIGKFMKFVGDAILVGHNVTFDMGFLNAALVRMGRTKVQQPVIDTLELSRLAHPENSVHNLDALSKRYHIVLEHHHRADSDAETTGLLLYKLFDEHERLFQATELQQLNNQVGHGQAYRMARPHHAILLAQTQQGLKNLFKIISLSMIKYFFRVARVPKSLLAQYREGILVGSACANGEVFTAMMQKGYEEARIHASLYDYLEIMPPAVYHPLITRGLVNSKDELQEIIRNIVKLGDELGKPVVATGDVHYLDPKDAIYREILIRADKSNPLHRQELPEAHFRTTSEMLNDFNFLGSDLAQKVVVTNTRAIAHQIEDIVPVKDKLYTPKMPGAEERIRQLAEDKAHELYGNPLPELVQKRLDHELNSIISNGFSVIYLIAQRLVFKSNKDGYLVGSRGSVGSSLVATMTGITEVNPLPPHYRCSHCHYSEFYTKGEFGSGYDLPDKSCPTCGQELVKDGHDIPFETFLGFKGDKVPDIDLNFSGDYQPIAHNYTKVLFGEKFVFRAGTIGTVADRTAFGYVKHYEEVTNHQYANAELERLALGTAGAKRTTGQHPAGIIVVPDDMEIYDFTPIQYPADKTDAAWRTTHFDFHSIHDNILKLDILGHDDPTMIRMLQDLTGIDPVTIPTDDPGVMSLFSSPKILGVTSEQINSKTGTLGIPEFGTAFVRGMLEETHPTTFAELLQISGLSHGTDVWLGNAEALINEKTATLKNVIGCRDNIMLDLIHWGMDSQMSFQIMESVRKGKGLKPEWREAMEENPQVPDWYIDSCLKIKYMFPKAHATAYIMMALRIAYFKVYFPVVYYAAYFSVRADDFDLEAMAHGKDAVKTRIKELNQEISEKGKSKAVKQANLLTVMELANECLERGIQIKMVDIMKSDAKDFLIMDDHTILAPFNAVPSLGDNVAKQILAARAEQPFLSKEDLANRGKVSQTIMSYFEKNNVLTELPDANQLSLF